MSKYFFGSFLFLIAAITFSAIAVSAAQQPEEIPAPPPQAEAADNSPAAFPHLEFSHIRGLYREAATEKLNDLLKLHDTVLVDKKMVATNSYPYYHIYCEDRDYDGTIHIRVLEHPADSSSIAICSIHWAVIELDGVMQFENKVITDLQISHLERYRHFFNLKAP